MLGAVAAFPVDLLIARLERIADKNKALRDRTRTASLAAELAAAFVRRMELPRPRHLSCGSERARHRRAAHSRLSRRASGDRAWAGRGDDVHLGAPASDGFPRSACPGDSRLYEAHAPRVRNFGPVGGPRNDRSPVYYDTRGAILKCPLNVDSGRRPNVSNAQKAVLQDASIQ